MLILESVAFPDPDDVGSTTENALIHKRQSIVDMPFSLFTLCWFGERLKMDLLSLPHPNNHTLHMTLIQQHTLHRLQIRHHIDVL